MNIFNTNIKILAEKLLPTFLRTATVMAFINAVSTAFQWLLNALLVFRNECAYILEITPQIPFLEKALNDRFDLALRRIYIDDGVFRAFLFLFKKMEQRPIYVYSAAENQPKYIYQSGEYGYKGASFTVHVPADLATKIPDIKALVEAFKLVGREFEIINF